MTFRTSVEDILYGRRRSPALEAFLRLVSLAYRLAIEARNVAYQIKFFRSHRLPVQVLSIGNITLGGTGKTPAAVHVAALLLRCGRKPVIVSRGYGRPSQRTVDIVSDGERTMIGPDAAGDEPAMMAARLPGVPVVVGADRYGAGRIAIDRFRPDTILLDDGFQHRKLARDLDIVLVDGADPFGNARMFPAGILREPLSALRRAQVVLITRADRAADLDGLKETIGKRTQAAIVTATYRPTGLIDVATGAMKPLSMLKGAHVLAFAGIARPDAFEASLAGLGADITMFRSYPDHHPYSIADMKILLEESARSASLLVTTEKDGVKLKGIAPAGIWMLRVELEIVERDIWEAAICPRQ